MTETRSFLATFNDELAEGLQNVCIAITTADAIKGIRRDHLLEILDGDSGLREISELVTRGVIMTIEPGESSEQSTDNNISRYRFTNEEDYHALKTYLETVE